MRIRIVKLFAFLFVTLLVWEVVLRSLPIGIPRYDPDLFWTNFPTFGSQVNQLGFRGLLHPLNETDAFQILTLGCSSTFGLGYRDANTYPRILEKTLSNRFPKKTVRVINAGVDGYSSHQGLILLEKLTPNIRPDVVTFMFGNNDHYISRFGLKDTQRAAPALSSWQKALHKSQSALAQLYLFISLSWGRQAEAKGTRVPLDDFQRNLEKTEKFCKENNIRLLLLTYPSQSPDHPIKEYNQLVRDFALANHVPIVDVARRLRPLGDEAYFRDKNHPSKLGHQKIAQWIADDLQEIMQESIL